MIKMKVKNAWKLIILKILIILIILSGKINIKIEKIAIMTIKNHRRLTILVLTKIKIMKYLLNRIPSI